MCICYESLLIIIMTHKSNIINSAIATGIAEIATLPICTIKTNYQNTNSISIYQTIKSLYINGGIKSFYRASPAAISSQIFSTSSKYFLYKYFESKNFKHSNKVLNGIMAGILTSLITHPIDTIKIHLQMNSSFKHQFKIDGLKLFYKGYSKTFGKTFISSCLFLPVYDKLNENLKNSFTASMLSAIISTTTMQPLDYLKTRHIYGLPLYQGFNPKIYYKGLSLNLMRVVPHFVIVMTTIDALNKNLIFN
ncbi:mitochondrial carrier-like protein [Cotonvirus japonicus]|uniref:Mitochondrial carrier-like protein n=1 Tax=Cotonvirus japonicus TaxID=2811091 RepID=A0ABM7NRC5_9VIRU|nr:mitochondrial carrier-like protein [Cotonvirus japonicus]BCS82713.1 mitochondrial carrier-like protein [Cotonvirus japonicus]